MSGKDEEVGSATPVASAAAPTGASGVKIGSKHPGHQADPSDRRHVDVIQPDGPLFCLWQLIFWLVVFPGISLPIILVFCLPVLIATKLCGACGKSCASCALRLLCCVTVRKGKLMEWTEWYKPAPAPAGFPEKLKGVYYMDGNPAPDDIVCLAASAYDPKTRTLHQVVAANNCWSWHDTASGWFIFYLVSITGLTYRFQFDETHDNCQITMWMWNCLRVPIKGLLGYFTMHFEPNGRPEGATWERRSFKKLDGSVSDYYWLRPLMLADRKTIVEANMTKLKAQCDGEENPLGGTGYTWNDSFVRVPCC